LISIFAFDLLEYFSGRHAFILKINNKILRYGILFVLLITTFLYMFQSEPLPFIYFQF
jgi:hypothetical protein